MFSRTLNRFFIRAAIAALISIPPAAVAQTPFVNDIVQSGGFVGYNVAFALAEDGTEHIAYWDIGNFWLVYATRSGGTWLTEIIEASGFAGIEIDLAVDSQGVPHVCWHNFTITSQVLRYANRTGGIWNVETVDSSGADLGRYNGIAIGPSDLPHIVYQDVTNADALYAVKSGVWMKETVTSVGDRGYYSSIAVDNSGRPHVATASSPVSEFYYAFKNAGSFNVLLEDNNLAIGSSIALNNQDHPLIAFSIGGGAQYSDHIGGFIEDVDPAVSFSGLISMKIDAAGVAHMAYEEFFGNRSLTYAKRLGAGSWSIEIVDATGDVGEFPNLDLDEYGNPVIVHYDGDNGDVRIADSRVRLTSDLDGVSWPVGATRTVSWAGGGHVDIELSTDGGASYQTIESGLQSSGDGSGDEHTFIVPHTPSRFCKLRVKRTDPYSLSENDSLFTIETDVSLLNLVVTLPAADGGTAVSWATNPGPEDLAGYKLERGREGSWTTVISLTKETSFHDTEGRRSDRYRLYAVNGLDMEMLLGEAGADDVPSLPSELRAWPNPFHGGALTLAFPTAGGVGGGTANARVEVFDVSGRLVRTLTDQAYPQGVFTLTWNGRDTGGQLVPSGVYFIRSTTVGVALTRKLVVVR